MVENGGGQGKRRVRGACGPEGTARGAPPSPMRAGEAHKATTPFLAIRSGVVAFKGGLTAP
jgi:hypothetical protein